ncbi:MAG: hypothetical protein NC930_07635 [Candidatus Omnitrophica bacterium]|nr:hypothetical protein [Candidatus Omnitrophota bacterium]
MRYQIGISRSKERGKPILATRFRQRIWPIIALPFLLAGTGALVAIFNHCLKGSKRAYFWIIRGMSTVILGAVALEFSVNFLNKDYKALTRIAEVIFEESFEMLGAVMIIAGLFAHQEFLQTKQHHEGIFDNVRDEVVV